MLLAVMKSGVKGVRQAVGAAGGALVAGMVDPRSLVRCEHCKEWGVRAAPKVTRAYSTSCWMCLSWKARTTSCTAALLYSISASDSAERSNTTTTISFVMIQKREDKNETN